jgi:predicted TIM-barrel fold metal-dependent hydrolase
MFNGYKVLDVHGHMSAPAEFQQYATVLIASQSVTARLKLTDEELDAALQRHLRDIDERNIDVQLVGPRPFAMFQWLRADLQLDWCRTTNDVIAHIVRLHPDRFIGMAQLPQNAELDTSNCVEELERCVKELGFAGAYLNPDPDGRKQAPGVNTPYWYPIYEKAQKLNVPLLVHPSGTFDPRVAPLTANYQINNVTEEYIATQLFSRMDVFDRFPDLKIIICHCGGALDRWIPTDPKLSQKDLSRNLFFDSCAHDERFLTASIQQRGVDQVLFGSEVPGAGKAPRPATGRPADDLVPIVGAFDFLSDNDKKKIFNTNAKRVVPAFANL